ncbi:MAG: NUDIX domain-containing protein [Pseudomonadota bacterium]
MSDGDTRASATVVLLREGTRKPELLLVQRHAATAFGGTWAFPGGVLDPDDAQVASACAGVSAAAADALLNTDSALDYFSAAVRELFEETGVLLARSDAEPPRTDREALNTGALRWRDFVTARSLRLDCAALHYFSYWVTPKNVGKRFRTRFFVAELPAGQCAAHCGRELTDSQWLTAEEALRRHCEDELAMILPTLKTLEWLQPFDSVAAAILEARQLAAEGVVEMLPKAITVDGERRILLPGEPGYAEIPA